MISRLLELVLSCEEDPNVKLIVLKGKGKAFCVGGDVAAVVHDIRQGGWRLGENFFRKGFTLHYVAATYKKPQVSILNGIVMGGGACISISGRFQVVTENSVLAMPETALGTSVGVVASYFFSRLPGFFGEYVGLTGSRLDGGEMLACGLATHYVPSERLSSLEESLHKLDSGDPAVIAAAISEFSKIPTLKQKSAYHRLGLINKCFSQKTIEEIISALEMEAAQNKDDWISTTIQSLRKASPTALKISLRSIREGRHQGIGKCVIDGYRVVCNVMRGEVSKDFFEGCRAILLDKDMNPKWEPSKLELVSHQMVEHYFSKIEDENWEDLQLPASTDLPTRAIAKL